MLFNLSSGKLLFFRHTFHCSPSSCCTFFFSTETARTERLAIVIRRNIVSGSGSMGRKLCKIAWNMRDDGTNHSILEYISLMQSNNILPTPTDFRLKSIESPIEPGKGHLTLSKCLSLSTPSRRPQNFHWKMQSSEYCMRGKSFSC